VKTFCGPTPQQASSSSLSARRRLRERLSHPLQVLTWKSDVLTKLTVLTRLHENHSAKRRIQWTDRVGELYSLRGVVFPSSHPAMEVRHATRLADGENVVIKVRDKRESFISSKEEKDWRMNTEFMLNIPKSGCIVQLFDVLEDSQNYYVVMEKATGQDLFETLDCNGRLPIFDCKEIIRQLLTAVAELHGRGCIHKDLKLENVMVDRSPTKLMSSWNSVSTACSVPEPPEPQSPVVKLIDFDTVEEWTPQGSGKGPKSVVGTDQYIAQEAYAGRYSPASDVFAVGVIAYRLLTGQFPFHPSIFDDEAGENWVGSPKMKQIQERLQGFRINWDLEPFPTETLACDLCASMLAVDETERPKAAQALQHAWLRGDRPSASGSQSMLFQATATSSSFLPDRPNSRSCSPQKARSCSPQKASSSRIPPPP